MKELFRMWATTRMVTLVAISAALFAAAVIPFKGVMIAGVTIRPGAVVAPVVGILFGPAGAFGAGIGNFIGDFFGEMGAGSEFGVLANFAWAFAAYKIWYSLGVLNGDGRPLVKTGKKFIAFLLTVVGSSLMQVAMVSYGISGVYEFVPYSVLMPLLLGSAISPLVLGIPLLLLVYPRVRGWGLLFTQVMEPDQISRPKWPVAAHAIFWVSLPFITALPWIMSVRGADMFFTAMVTTPPLVLTFVGLAMMGVPRRVLDDEDVTTGGHARGRI